MILWMNEAPERDAILANNALKRKRYLQLKLTPRNKDTDIFLTTG